MPSIYKTPVLFLTIAFIFDHGIPIYKCKTFSIYFLLKAIQRAHTFKLECVNSAAFIMSSDIPGIFPGYQIFVTEIDIILVVFISSRVFD